MDLKDLDNIYSSCCFDAIVCNPPYKKLSTGIVNYTDTKTIARHEVFCSLEDIIKKIAKDRNVNKNEIYQQFLN